LENTKQVIPIMLYIVYAARLPSDYEPMTSVFYDVIRFESVRGRSNVLLQGNLWRFWGKLNPKMLSVIVWAPKMQLLTSQRVFWAIVH